MKSRLDTMAHGSRIRARPGCQRSIRRAHARRRTRSANKRSDVNVTAADLLHVPEGPITEQGLRLNVDVGIQYIAAWLNGNGACRSTT